MPYKDYQKQLESARASYRRRMADPVLAEARRKRAREWKRNKYHTDKEFRESECAAARKWWKENESRALNNKRKSDARYKAKPGICEIHRGHSAKLYRDHCHKSGFFRGFICHNCNTILGHAKDNPVTLQEAINYLVRFQERIKKDPNGQLVPPVDGLLGSNRTSSELCLVQRDSSNGGRVRPKMLGRSGRAHPIRLGQSFADSPLGSRKKYGSPGHGDEAPDNSPPGWTSQADGVGREAD